ncbi:MAG TPA: peptidoglycan-associated lipoprotein Pal [Alphaproteobacteria bacterium]|nr:peptidoglycan-associated lipoprotein Pal [Alphaproteobacteria bacterium]
MRTKVLSLFALALLASACSSTPETTAAGNSGGNTAPAATQPAQPMAGGIQAGSREDFEINVGDRVFFGTDKSDIAAEARATLDKQAAWLQQYPSVTAVIEGHADERGTREYNLALGERRANAVKNYLQAAGVNPARLSTVSYGKERPAVLGSNEAAWQQNRRGVTVVQ